MGQELHSCDTTQIDVYTSARLRVPSYAPRWITGGNPSASTEASARSSRPPKSIHPVPGGCARTIHSSLDAGVPGLLLFITGLEIYLLWLLYAPQPGLSTPFLIFSKSGGRNRNIPAPAALGYSALESRSSFRRRNANFVSEHSTARKISPKPASSRGVTGS